MYPLYNEILILLKEMYEYWSVSQERMAMITVMMIRHT